MHGKNIGDPSLCAALFIVVSLAFSVRYRLDPWIISGESAASRALCSGKSFEGAGQRDVTLPLVVPGTIR
jgi:hypothetical protein